MSEYRVTLLDGTERIAVRNDSRGVTDDFETDLNPIVQVQRTRTNLDVHLPDTMQQVFFRLRVTPQAAVDAASIATPTEFTVMNGTDVVLQALPGAGFRFSGWFLDAPINAEDAATFDPTIPFSIEPTVVMRITAPAPGQTRLIEARFAPAP